MAQRRGQTLWRERVVRREAAPALPPECQPHGQEVGDNRPFALAAHRVFVLRRISETPDLTITALTEELAAHGIKVSRFAVWHVLQHERLGFRRNSLHAERQVFIDQTRTKTSGTRTHGRSLCGTRLDDKVPCGRWRTLTFIAVLRRNRMTAPCVSDGPINAIRFRAHVQQVLVPTLKPGDIVIMDNLGSHESATVETIIRNEGATAVFLPPHSPDFNLIEQACARLKSGLRKENPRSTDTVCEAIESMLDLFTSTKCANDFVNSGRCSV